MRRQSRTIVALAIPLFSLLAVGCAKKSSGRDASYPGGSVSSQAYDDSYYDGGDSIAYSEDDDASRDYDYEGAADGAEAEEVAVLDEAPPPDFAADSEPEPQSAPEPMYAPADREMSVADAGRSRRASRRSRRESRKSRRDHKKARAMAKNGAPSAPIVAQQTSVATPPAVVAQPVTPPSNTENYSPIHENDFIAVADDPRSTFSIDVDTASYSNTRRMLNDGHLPPPDAVRLEELINYFDYDYAQPTGSDPFSVATEVAPCPWAPDHRLVHLGLQGKDVAAKEVPPRNLVFLLDVSGSMNDSDKLPLLKRGLNMLAKDIRAQDSVSIVVYAGASGVVLEPTSDRTRIAQALNRLQAGGSTNGGAGIELAYQLARENFVDGGINRVLLATDGDFNVGVTSQGGLVRLIERERESGVFLSVLGFGRGNLQDSTMEQLADKGNGNYAYIDSGAEAHKVLVEQAGATLMTIAKDVKIQVEFNPAEVASYRLVGYENRKLAHRDFNDDTKDAGEIGAGHTVTALYEIVPVGQGVAPDVDPLKYQDRPELQAAAGSGELMTVKLRFKRPRGSKSTLRSVPVFDGDNPVADSSADFRFSAAVAQFGLLLRNSKWRGEASWSSAHELARSGQGTDPKGRRAEFLSLIEKAAALSGQDIYVAKSGAKVAR